MHRTRCRIVFLAAGLVLAQPAYAQQLAGGSSPDISIVRVVLALVICIAAAFGLVVCLRLRGSSPSLPRLDFLKIGKAGKQRIEVLEARRLSPHADICLVAHDGQEYLLLCGSSGLQVLSSKPAKATDEHISNAEA